MKHAVALTLSTWNGCELLELTPISMLADMQSRLRVFKNSKASTSVTNGKN